MKKIGIVGGMGPEPTVEYYQYIIDFFRRKRGTNDAPEMVIYSVNVQEFIKLVENRETKKAVNWLIKPIEALQRAGADFALIAAGTPHLFFDDVKKRSSIPLLSIVEETCKKAKQLNLKKLLLLGTKFTMQAEFFQKVFSADNIKLVVPDEDDRDYIHSKLIEELQFGKIVDATRDKMHSIIKKIIENESIEGIILGCTELPLIMPEDQLFSLPLLNTTKIHAESAVEYCLE
jgi:aspartate racemase